MDVKPLARLSDTLALEGVPFSLAFGEGRGEVLDACGSVFIIIANADGASASEDACGQLEIGLVLADVGTSIHTYKCAVLA